MKYKFCDYIIIYLKYKNKSEIRLRSDFFQITEFDMILQKIFFKFKKKFLNFRFSKFYLPKKFHVWEKSEISEFHLKLQKIFFKYKKKNLKFQIFKNSLTQKFSYLGKKIWNFRICRNSVIWLRSDFSEITEFVLRFQKNSTKIFYSVTLSLTVFMKWA